MNATRNVLALVCGIVAVFPADRLAADFSFGAPARVGGPVYSDDLIDCLSYDGLEMYISSTRGPTQGRLDLLVLKRASEDDEWGPPENLGPAVNGPGNEGPASISADGLTLYFCSDRPYNDNARYDVFVATRATKSDPWGQAVRMGPAINGPGGTNFGVWISPDNLELYVNGMSNRPGGYGMTDIFVARRATPGDPWTDAVNLGPIVNSATRESLCSLSPDGLVLLFCELWQTTETTRRPGGCGGPDMWMARRATLSDPWQAPVNLGPMVNGPSADAQPRISADGCTLYFSSNRSGAWDNYQAAILPNCDFTGDGKVDATDLALLVADWGKSNSVCDIGPFAWGDGVVDEKDLKVLMESLMTPGPKASDVPCDVVLSWISPSFAQTCDVYFGTSQETVSSASRTDPRGVLVSQGQTALTYAPAGLLEFGRTYYWRVDFVASGPTPAIYRGPVLHFTTEPFARPIKGITATASSRQRGMGPERTIDGSGLDKNEGHSMQPTDMWLSLAEAPTWIQFDFDQVYALYEMWVWNYNAWTASTPGFGFKKAGVEYSTDGKDWAALAETEFAQAPGQGSYVHNTTVSFNGVPAKHVRLTAQSTWGGAAAPCGLSEVRFLYIPDRSATKP